MVAIRAPDELWLDTQRSDVQGFRPVSGHEGRTYWSRPDVARAHGASSWPTKAPRAGPASQALGREAAATPPAALSGAQPPCCTGGLDMHSCGHACSSCLDTEEGASSLSRHLMKRTL